MSDLELDFEGSDTVVIGTESRTWEGSPEEFHELKAALDDIELQGAPDSTSEDEKEIDEVYEDRNLLACALIATAEPGMGGWTPAPDADSDEWAIAWLETPAGQVSWHVPRVLAERLLPRRDGYEWDGHTRTEKNERLEAWLEQGGER